MITRHEHLRHRAPVPQLRASILRIFEQTLGETLLGQRLGASDDTRQQSHTGVDQRDRRGLAARQHKVAEAYLLDAARFQHTLVHTLELVRDGAPPVLVPFTRAVVPIVAPAEGRLVLDPPPGLLDDPGLLGDDEP